MSIVRLRRLNADFEKLRDYTRRHPRVELVQHDGDPPERYQLRYEIRSLRQKGEELFAVTDHMVEIVLPRDYPRTPPQCRMLTPIFHPNIAPHAICIGDHWSAGESLESIVTRIGEMIAYQSYNTKSPLNGEAARWVDENMDRLPLDSVIMVAEEAAEGPVVAGTPVPSADAPTNDVPEATPVAPPPSPSDKVQTTCAACGAILRVPVAALGKKVRCPKCQTIVPVPDNAPPA